MKTYLSWCSRCNRKTPQTIYSLSRFRGVKLRCFICRHIKQRYHNPKFLTELKGGKKDKCQRKLI
jgi:hypothetical protein